MIMKQKSVIRLPLLLFILLTVIFSAGLTGRAAFADDRYYSYYGQLEDYQNALTDEQQKELLLLLDETAEAIRANVGVILAGSDMDGMSEYSYTKAFHNRCFGENSDSIVIMLVQTGSGKVDQIYCTDAAYDMYYSKIDRIFDTVYIGLDSNGGDNYYAAVEKFCSYLANHSYVSAPAVSIINSGTIVGLIIALIATIIVVNASASGYVRKAPVSARAYIHSSGVKFTERSDVFVREYTTTHRISSGSSGESHHSHGGGHRSGGGGGRRR